MRPVADERERERERERANFENVTLALLTLHLIWTDFLLARPTGHRCIQFGHSISSFE
jgi:hypothetical protein